LKKYECLYIVNINYDSEGISAVTTRVEEVLKNVGAELVNTQHWGKRKLAYPIDKERYGNYVLIHFQGENPDITELHREFEIEAGVLHYMTIRLDEFPDFDTLSVPQAYETERRRSASPGTRRPRSYERDAQPEAVIENVAADDVALVAETAEVSDEVAVVEEPDEVAEVLTGEIEKDEEASEAVEEPAEESATEESADKADEDKTTADAE